MRSTRAEAIEAAKSIGLRGRINDGAVDLILANGHQDDMIENYDAGPAFEKSYSARGLPVGDFNNDGRLNVLIGTNGGTPVLLKNHAGSGNNWLGPKLQERICNRDAIGARIRWQAGGVVQSRLKNGGGSYLSSHDPREVPGWKCREDRMGGDHLAQPKVQRIENPQI